MPIDKVSELMKELSAVRNFLQHLSGAKKRAGVETMFSFKGDRIRAYIDHESMARFMRAREVELVNELDKHRATVDKLCVQLQEFRTH